MHRLMQDGISSQDLQAETEVQKGADLGWKKVRSLLGLRFILKCLLDNLSGKTLYLV
jgi:hypothetical protein